jgi:hypothetical protein
VSAGARTATRRHVLRDLRLLSVFAVLRGGCGWRCPDTESAGAHSGDGLAAALEENARLRAENAELRVALAQVLARDGEQDAELEKLRADLAVVRRILSGRSSERSRREPPGGGGAAGDGGQGGDRASGTGNKRGPGARAGRRDYPHLPRVGRGVLGLSRGRVLLPGVRGTVHPAG